MLEAEATAQAKVGACEPLERSGEDRTVSWSLGGSASQSCTVTLHFSIVGVQQLLFPC